jgi:hypothetical protein
MKRTGAPSSFSSSLAHGFRLWHLSPGYFCKRTHRLLDFDALLVNSALAPPFS